MIFQEEEWELVPFDKIIDCEGKDVLLCGNDHYCDNCVVPCARVEVLSSRELIIWYHHATLDGCTHCTIHASSYDDNSSYTPYVKKGTMGNMVDRKSYCMCAGPIEDRWCYDTNKMEPICCRCKKRKD